MSETLTNLREALDLSHGDLKDALRDLIEDRRHGAHLVPLRKMPKEGQFIAMWIFGGYPWSDVFRWKNGQLTKYDSEQDTFFVHTGHVVHPGEDTHVLYYTVEGGDVEL